MRRSRSSFVAGLALVAVSRAAAAQAIPTVEGGAFLLLPVGARAVALGQAAAADGGTSESLFWNPAGLAALPGAEFAVHHYTLFFGTGDAAVLAVPSASLGTFAASAYIVDYGDLDVTRGDIGPDPVGQIRPRNIVLLGSYATDVVAGFAAGVTYKLIQFRVDCAGECSGVPAATGTTHAVDIGIRYVSPAAFPLVIGAALRNVGFRLQVNNQAQADPLPTRLAVGVSYGVLRRPAGGQGFDLRVLADLQGSLGRGTLSPVTLVGVESGVGESVRFRGGYAFLDSEAKGPSLGIGLKLGTVALDLGRVFSARANLGEDEPIHVSFRMIF
ncbi:MAG: PorV/PorQ family protein [Gemmatimonadetes bacterium]|nr:PorV/PorQ family protein [Gemmatimonadota bacterium]